MCTPVWDVGHSLPLTDVAKRLETSLMPLIMKRVSINITAASIRVL